MRKMSGVTAHIPVASTHVSVPPVTMSARMRLRCCVACASRLVVTSAPGDEFRIVRADECPLHR